MEKVLLVGPNYFGINESIESALEDLGYDVLTFNFFESYPKSMVNRITYGLMSKIGINNKIVEYDKKVNHDLIMEYNSFNPDYVIVIKGHKLTRETLIEMKASKLILWMMDSVQRVNNVTDTMDLYDSINVFEEDDVNYLGDRGIDAHLVPLALDQNKYFPIDSKKEIDIIFIGSLYAERVSILKEIIDKFPDKKVLVYGFFPSWKLQLRHLFINCSRYRKSFVIKKVSAAEANLLYSKSRIILNLHLNFSLSGTNLRFYEVAGTNSIQLVNKKHYIEKEFEYEDLMFDSYEKLIEVIESIIDNDIKAKSIAYKAFDQTIKQHTFKERVKRILSVQKNVN